MAYHVRLAAGPLNLRIKELFNLDRQRLVSEIVEPWRRGEPIMLDGRRWAPDTTKLTVYEGPELTSNQRSMWQGWAKAMEFGEDVTTDVLAEGFPQSANRSADVSGALEPDALAAQLTRHEDWAEHNVAVAYGRDSDAREAMFDWLRALGLEPLEWSTLVAGVREATPSTFSVVRHAFETSQAVVVLFTPDDEARLHDSLAKPGDSESRLEMQPRQNVLVEAGMALAYYPKRTIIVEIGTLRQISNLAGLNTVRMDGSPPPLNELATRLENAGCPVRRDGTAWLDSHRFADLRALTREPRREAEPEGLSAQPWDRRFAGADEQESTEITSAQTRFPGVDEEDLTEVAAAARRAGLPEDTRRDLVIIGFLRQRTEPFHGGELAQALPAPNLLGDEMKRLLVELYRSELIARNEDERRGWISRRNPDTVS